MMLGSKSPHSAIFLQKTSLSVCPRFPVSGQWLSVRSPVIHDAQVFHPSAKPVLAKDFNSIHKRTVSRRITNNSEVSQQMLSGVDTVGVYEGVNRLRQVTTVPNIVCGKSTKSDYRMSDILCDFTSKFEGE